QDASMYYALELHEPRGGGETSSAWCGGRYPAGVALSGHAHAGQTVRLRPIALLPAVTEHLRGGRNRGWRFGSHAEDRLAAFDQPVQPVFGNVGNDYAAGPMVRGEAPSRGGAHARAGDSLLHHQQRLSPIQRERDWIDR